MDRNYAIIDSSSGKVVNIVVWDGISYTPPTEDEPAAGWSPPDGELAVEIPDGSEAGIGWAYADGQFVAPPAPAAPPRTAAETLATNTATRNQLLAAANLVVPALQDAVDLDDPAADAVLLKAWKQFRVDVNKVDVTKPDPAWPVAPQVGYGAAHIASDQLA